jgi:LETM1 and EF-hand domain-containing protein 1
MIIKEGVENLTIYELQQACRDRGIRAVGMSEIRLRKQIDQWLDLHINRKILISLLVLSRALYLPENTAQEELIKSTISTLPETIVRFLFEKKTKN